MPPLRCLPSLPLTSRGASAPFFYALMRIVVSRWYQRSYGGGAARIVPSPYVITTYVNSILICCNSNNNKDLGQVTSCNCRCILYNGSCKSLCGKELGLFSTFLKGSSANGVSLVCPVYLCYHVSLMLKWEGWAAWAVWPFFVSSILGSYRSHSLAREFL